MQSQVSAIRLTLAKLVILFYIVHPGSAATFGDTKSFLISRYPNRDVLPESPRFRRSYGMHGNDDDRMLFVRPPMRPSGVPVSCPPEKVPIPPSSPARPQLRSYTAASPACPASPGRGRAMPVVIGEFVSALEARDSRGNGPSGPEGANGSPQMQTLMGLETEADNSPGAEHRGVGMLKRGATSLLEACDSVLSFVESKALKALAGQGSEAVKRVKTELAGTVRSQRLNIPGIKAGSSITYDLVGFMDVDPFERSRRYFKRNSRLLM